VLAAQEIHAWNNWDDRLFRLLGVANFLLYHLLRLGLRGSDNLVLRILTSHTLSLLGLSFVQLLDSCPLDSVGLDDLRLQSLLLGDALLGALLALLFRWNAPAEHAFQADAECVRSTANVGSIFLLFLCFIKERLLIHTS